MRRGRFPLSDLPVWCKLNNITFDGATVADTKGRGLGLFAERALSNENDEPLVLVTIPEEHILSAAGIEEYAKENKDFRQLLDVAGHLSLRGDVLLFLLTQLVLASPDYHGRQRGSTAWTQYFNLLPQQVPVPTLWTQSEISLLRGTSLESAVSAKLFALEREFDRIQSATADLSWWNELIGTDNAVTISDWILLDALYRSRSLALPKSGESMVPCLDLVNHSDRATAYFEENSKGEVVLLLRNGEMVLEQDELTIDYGHDKSAAEMLFSYGFINSTSTTKSVVLPVRPLDDDPLAKAKLHVFGSAPTLRITDGGTGALEWDAPFIYLMCLNDEDGLQFKILQETDGSQHLKMFWQDIDVTEEVGDMKNLIKGHELAQIFRLRAVAVVHGTIQQQLEALKAHEGPTLTGTERPHILEASSQLRAAEKDLLDRIFQVLEHEKARLLEHESVTAYLAAMDGTQQDDSGDEDFS